MGVSYLQQQALSNNADFNAQVAGEVTKLALYKKDTMPTLDQASSDLLARVVRSPNSYGFASTIIAANTWDMTFDVWSADPAGAAATVAAAVDHNFDFLTGFNPPEPPP